MNIKCPKCNEVYEYDLFLPEDETIFENDDTVQANCDCGAQIIITLEMSIKDDSTSDAA